MSSRTADDDDEDYELMQLQTVEHIYCEVPDHPIMREVANDSFIVHRRIHSTSNIPTTTNNKSNDSNTSNKQRQSWSATKPLSSPTASSPTPIKRPRSPKPKPRIRLRAMTTNSIDAQEEKQQQKCSTPPPPVSVSLNTQISTGFGPLQLKDIPPTSLSPDDHTDDTTDPVYVNIIDIPDTNHQVISNDIIDTADHQVISDNIERSIISELIASRKREELLMKRIDEQDQRIDNLEDSLQSLKIEFSKLLTLSRSSELNDSTAVYNHKPVVKQPPCVFVMKQFSQYLYTPGKEWYSEPFYTSQMGYKMCLQVVAYGLGTSAGRDVSICIRLMRGEFDDKLMFPFYGDISIQIVNHIGDYKHANRVISFGGEAMKYGSCRRVRQGTCDASNPEMAALGWGISAFIPHTFLPYNKDQKTEFVRNDSLTIKIINTVDSNVYVNT